MTDNHPASVMGKRTKIALALFFGALYLVPVFLTAICRIHPTTTMVHEQLSINYLSLDFLGIGYFITQTGQFSILLLAYPASVASHVFADGASNYTRMEFFIQGYYLMHGLLLWSIGLWIIRNGRLSAAMTTGLLLIPVVVPAVEQVTNLGLMINYNKATDLVFLILGYAIVASFRDDAKLRWPAWAAAGCLVGFAVGIKFSIGIVTLLFAASMLLSGSRGASWRIFFFRGFVAVVATITTVLLGLWVFHRFNLSYLRRFLREIVELYRSGFLSQHTPFLDAELSKIASPDSYYFAGQLLLIAWLASLILLCLVSYRRNTLGRSVPLIASQFLVFAFLLFQLSKRFTQGTMIDITAVLGLAFVVNMIIAGLQDREKRPGIWGQGLVAALVLIVSVGVATAHLPLRFSSMIRNSRELARLDKLMSDHPDLGCIYFGTSLLQPTIFPSPDLIVQTRAPSERFIKKMAPRMQWHSAGVSLPATPLIAVVADCVRVPPRTPEALGKWPQMYKPYDGDVLFPALLTALESRASERLDLQFVPLQADDDLLYYFMYPTRVRIFVVSPAAPPK